MAWDTNNKKIAIKVIGTVESSLKYDAINYNDPITVGIAQWFGSRAINLLDTIFRVHPADAQPHANGRLRQQMRQWGKDSPNWSTFYLGRDEGDGWIKPLLAKAAALQDKQLVTDLEGYTATAIQYGLDYNSNTETFIMWACAYHQSPREALRVLNRNGGALTLDQMYNAIMANGVLGQYRNRYNQALAIIKSGDTSGVGSTAFDSTVTPGNGGVITQYGKQNIDIPEVGMILTADDSGMPIIRTSEANIFMYPTGGYNTWKGVLPKRSVQMDIRNQTFIVNPGGGGTPGGGDGSAGAKAVEWMRSRIMKFSYMQAPGRLDPDKSGFSDCSGTIWRAYKDTSGLEVGTWTGDQYFRGKAVIERGSGNMSDAQKALCKPGDIIVMSWGRGYPHTDHVEMYVDAGHTIGHGGPGNGPHINPIGMLGNAVWWTVRRHG